MRSHPLLIAGLIVACLFVTPLAAQDPGAQPQPGTPGPGEPGPGPGPDAGGGTDEPVDPAVRMDEPPPPLPEWEIAWKAIGTAYLAVRDTVPIVEQSCVEVAERITAWLQQYSKENVTATDEAVTRLVTLFGDLTDANRLQTAINLIGDAEKTEGLTTTQRVLLLATRVDALMKQGYIMRGSEKIKKYGDAEAGARSLVTRDLSGLPTDAVMRLYLNQARALAKQGKMDQAYAAWLAGARRENDTTGRRLQLLNDLAGWLVLNAEWKLCQKLVEIYDQWYPKEERSSTSAQRNNLLLNYLSAQALDKDDAVVEARMELKKYGLVGHQLRLMLNHMLRSTPGQRANSFYLYDASETEAPHELENYSGRYVLMLFMNPAQRSNLRIWPQLLEATQRYSDRQLSVITIAAGKSFGTHLDKHRQVIDRYKPRGDYLIDETGSVTRTYGFGTVSGSVVGVELWPGYALIGPDGRIVRSSFLLGSNLELDLLIMRDHMEGAIELTTSGNDVLGPETGPPEASPEFELLKSMYDIIGLPRNSPVRGSRSVTRAALLLGPAGRADLRGRLVTMARAAEDLETRKLLMKLWERLKD
ncbi:MAG: peroxiredoxin family protein [Planctomycetota bacterium]